jgi:hypothetical protein
LGEAFGPSPESMAGRTIDGTRPRVIRFPSLTSVAARISSSMSAKSRVRAEPSRRPEHRIVDLDFGGYSARRDVECSRHLNLVAGVDTPPHHLVCQDRASRAACSLESFDVGAQGGSGDETAATDLHAGELTSFSNWYTVDRLTFSFCWISLSGTASAPGGHSSTGFGTSGGSGPGSCCDLSAACTASSMT